MNIKHFTLIGMILLAPLQVEATGQPRNTLRAFYQRALAAGTWGVYCAAITAGTAAVGALAFGVVGAYGGSLWGAASGVGKTLYAGIPQEHTFWSFMGKQLLQASRTGFKAGATFGAVGGALCGFGTSLTGSEPIDWSRRGGAWVIRGFQRS